MRPADAAFNPRYTFDAFVVAPSNERAAAACRAVAENPGSLNPLFIHGRPGLGRTHLLHAIAHDMLQRHAVLALLYRTTERFMSDMLSAARCDRMLDFRRRYGQLDVLLLDDLDFVLGKEGTIAETFQVFGELLAGHGQLVISSTHSPAEFGEALNRFSVVAVEIRRPDDLTSATIAKRKAAAEGVLLPDDVAAWLARNAVPDIRVLEGALARVVAYASLTRRDISLDLVKQMVRAA